VPIRDGRLRAVALHHLGGVGLDLMPAIEAPDDQTHLGGSGVAKGHRWPAGALHASNRLSVETHQGVGPFNITSSSTILRSKNDKVPLSLANKTIERKSFFKSSVCCPGIHGSPFLL